MEIREKFLLQTKKQLIVSCQALPDEPLHSPHIMARMAYAAMLGGAAGIRANSPEDICAIQEAVPLPIIGIIKRVHSHSDVYITPTMEEVKRLIECGVDVIAMDATQRPRPNGCTLAETFHTVRSAYPQQLFMADCSTYEEGIAAQELGFDFVGTTLCGYTSYTQGVLLPDYSLLVKLGQDLKIPLIAEGGIWTPEQLNKVLSIPGVHTAVIGSAITRPMEITRYFINGIKKTD